MDLARRRGVEVIEREIWPEELEGFEQMFLTGTAVEVTPVQSVGPWKFEVGDLTRQLARIMTTWSTAASPTPTSKIDRGRAFRSARTR